jgi:hypothetical protein
MKTTSGPLASPTASPSIGLVSAIVTGQADKWFFLGSADLQGGAWAGDRALRADSCLIAPECGDTVLVCNGVAVGVTAISYILAVLSRAHPSQGVVMLPGGATICANDGKLSLVATEIGIEGQGAVTVSAPQVKVVAVAGDLQFNSLRASILDFRGVLGKVSTVAQSMTSTVGRLVQKATDSFRWTQNLDESRAGRMRLQVAERFHLKSRHASVIAEGQVKIDGQKIDLG